MAMNNKLEALMKDEAVVAKLETLKSAEEMQELLEEQGVDFDDVDRQEVTGLLIDNEELELGEEELAGVAGGAAKRYLVPCNVCGLEFDGKTRKKAESALFWHVTLSSTHKKNWEKYGYNRFNNKPRTIG